MNQIFYLFVCLSAILSYTSLIHLVYGAKITSVSENLFTKIWYTIQLRPLGVSFNKVMPIWPWPWPLIPMKVNHWQMVNSFCIVKNRITNLENCCSLKHRLNKLDEWDWVCYISVLVIWTLIWPLIQMIVIHCLDRVWYLYFVL